MKTRSRHRGIIGVVAAALSAVVGAIAADAATASTVVYQCGAQVCAIDPDVPGSNRVIATGKPAGVTRDGLTAGYVDTAANIREIPLKAGGETRLMAAAGESPDFASISGDGGFSSWIWYYGGAFGWSMKVAPPGATNGNQWQTVASSTMQMSVGWTNDDQVLATRRGADTYDSRICIEQIGGPVCDVLLASEPDRSRHTAFPDMNPAGNTIVAVRGPENTGFGLPYYGQLALYARGSTTGPARILTNGADSHPEFSHEGDRVVFERQNQGIWVINTDGTGLRRIADGSMPFWGGPRTQTPSGHDPIGNYENGNAGAGIVWVKGWTFDADDPGASLSVHVYIGGPAGTPGAEAHVIGADKPRPDVNAAHGVPGNHGFDSTLTTAKRGPQQVCVYAINRGGGANAGLGCLTMTITEPAGPNHDPIGSYENGSGGRGTVWVKGWSFDANDPAASLPMHVYIGGPAGTPGAESHVISADRPRPDINTAHGVPGNHGFDATLTTAKRGPQQVCVSAINRPAGHNPSFGCLTLTIRDQATSDPRGALERVVGLPGAVQLSGWAFDPDVPAESLEVHVYVGGDWTTPGAESHSRPAGLPRPDVNAAHNITGDHGFSTQITTAKRGPQKVCLYGINKGAGETVELQCRTVTIPDGTPPPVNLAPLGVLESATGATGTVRVTGWAYDPDTLDAATDVEIRIGQAGAAGAETHVVPANARRSDSAGSHGFDATLTTAHRGAVQVCADAIDRTGGARTAIGCRDTTITAPTSPAPPGPGTTPPRSAGGATCPTRPRFNSVIYRDSVTSFYYRPQPGQTILGARRHGTRLRAMLRTPAGRSRLPRVEYTTAVLVNAGRLPWFAKKVGPRRVVTAVMSDASASGYSGIRLAYRPAPGTYAKLILPNGTVRTLAQGCPKITGYRTIYAQNIVVNRRSR